MIAARIINLTNSSYLQVVLYKTYADLISETKRFYIGYLWWIIEPVIDMAIYYTVFGYIFGNKSTDYIPFLLIGTVVWRWAQTSIMLGANSILANRPLTEQVYLPKTLLPTVSFFTNTFKFLIVFSLLLGLLVILGYPLNVAWLALPLLLVVESLFIASLMYLFAGLVPFFPDLRIALDSFFRILFFFSGIFYAIDSLPERLRPFFQLNPMAVIITNFRTVLIHGQWPDWQALTIISLLSISGALFGLWVLMRNDTVYPKVSQ